MPDPINYQALLDLIMAGDPVGMQAAGKLTPEERQQFFDFQKAQNTGKGEVGRAESDTLAAVPALGVLSLAGASSGAPVASTLKNAVTGGASWLGNTAKIGGSLYLANKAMEAMNAPADVKNAMMIALGLKGGIQSAPRSAPSAAAPTTLAEDVEASPNLAQMRDFRDRRLNVMPPLALTQALREENAAAPGESAPITTAVKPRISAAEVAQFLKEQERMKAVKQLLASPSFQGLPQPQQ